MAIGTWGNIKIKKIGEVGGKPRYQARTRMRDQDGVTRQVSATGATKTQADQALKAALARRKTPVGDGQMTPQTRYGDLVEQWLRKVSTDNAKTTYDTYRRVMRTVVLPRFGQLTIAEITAQRVDLMLADLSDRYTPNGVRQIKKVVSGSLDLARARGIIERNPVRDLSQIKGGAKAPRALTDDEEDQMMKFLDTDRRAREAHMGDIIRFLLGTGCRIGEALGVQWRDVDLEAGTVRITGSVIRVAGAGLDRGKGKSVAAQRVLTLPPEIVTMLADRRRPFMSDEWPVFPASTGNWRDLNNIQKLVRYVRSNVPDLGWMTTHTFRRTVATRMDAAGFTPREIANQLGHSRPSMSQDVYMDRRLSGPSRAAAALSRPERLRYRDGG